MPASVSTSVTCVLLVAVVVVVAEHRDHRHAEAAELRGDAARLVDRAVPGQVAGEQQHVGALRAVAPARAGTAEHVLVHVDVADGGDPDHEISSTSVGRLRPG